MNNIQRFTKFVQLDIVSGCWLWKGAHIPDGYGMFSKKSILILAHRFSYEYYHGKIPKGLVIDHLCRTKNCVNPDHLEAVTIWENCNRGIRKELKRFCKRGHLRSPENVDNGDHCRLCIKMRPKYKQL